MEGGSHRAQAEVSCTRVPLGHFLNVRLTKQSPTMLQQRKGRDLHTTTTKTPLDKHIPLLLLLLLLNKKKQTPCSLLHPVQSTNARVIQVVHTFDQPLTSMLSTGISPPGEYSANLELGEPLER